MKPRAAARIPTRRGTRKEWLRSVWEEPAEQLALPQLVAERNFEAQRLLTVVQLLQCLAYMMLVGSG
jgi:hypothetical protein